MAPRDSTSAAGSGFGLRPSGRLRAASEPHRPAQQPRNGAPFVRPDVRIFLANVGVNASHRLVSPLRHDGSFSLVTIPEEPRLAGPSLVRYGDVPHLRSAVPPRFWDQPTHYDPEFETRTYGDNCASAPRAAALKRCRPGDWIVFITRLVRDSIPCFALVGGLHVEAILRDVRARPAAAALRRFGRNAHVRRGLADPAFWNGFWVFAGSSASGLFPRAAIVGRDEADLLFRDREGKGWLWREGRTELQTIGSYTRSCRCVVDSAADPERAEALWRLIARSGFAVDLG